MRATQGWKLVVMAGAGALLLSACSSSSSGGGGTPTTSPANGASTAPSGASVAPGDGSSASSGGAPTTGTALKVGLAYDVGGRGDKAFNDLAAAGLEKAQKDLSINPKELSATAGEADSAKEARLSLLATAGYNPIIAVGFAYDAALGKVAKKFPKVNFALIDSDTSKGANIESLLFSENESSFLVGVAAAQATKTKQVGFIGGVNTPLIQKFQAGYAAGVKAVNPAIKIDVAYISQPPEYGGFNDPAKGKTIGEGQYDEGADVVYAAAGGSGAGLFQAAKEKNKLAIGVDADQYQTAPADERANVLTSALKAVDTAVYNFIEADSKGQFKAGSTRFGLKDGGVGYAVSNPAIAPFKAKIEEFKAKIVSGSLTVPTTP